MVPSKKDGDAVTDSLTNDSAPNSALYRDQVRLLYQMGRILPFNLVVVCVAIAMFWPIFPVGVLGTWLGLFCVVILGRSILHLNYDRATAESKAGSGWGRRYVAGACATGMLWGFCGFAILASSDPLFHVLAVFVLGGMVAGSMFGNSAYLPAFYGFMLPAVVPALLILLTRPDWHEIEMGLMLAGFAAVFTIVGHNINRLIRAHFWLRIGQDALVAKLQVSEAAMAEAQAIAHIGSWRFNDRTKDLSWSKETFRIFGVDPATFKPSWDGLFARMHPEDRAVVERLYSEAAAGRSALEIDHRIVLDGGGIKAVHESGRFVLSPEGRPDVAVGTIQDITERKNAENKFEFTSVLLTAEMEASPDGILVVDAEGDIVSCNERFSDMWQILPEDIEARKDQPVLAKVVAAMKDPSKFLARVQYLYAHPLESSHDELSTTTGKSIDRYTVGLHSPTGEYLGRVWFFHDVTEYREAAERVLHVARHDGLTGLVNRSVFVEALKRLIAQGERGERLFAVIYLDLDHFKDVNDTLGHPVGDELLRLVADRLRDQTRQTDIIARFGGDEFAVIAADIGEADDAAVLADKLLAAMRDPFSVQGIGIHSSASIGIDLYGPRALDAETLLSHADMALYRAKADGRGVYRFFTDAMDADVRLRVTLGAELRSAIDSAQFFLLYQLQVVADSGRITGVESLIRWRHPKRGVLGPDFFIPLAEKIGIIGELDHWVLWEACRQAKAWLDDGIAPIRISVNLSAQEFRTPIALENDIVAALAQTGLPAKWLELELTETVLMDASREHNDLLVRLRESGISVAIDDFGTGYSSLDYLRRFPVDRIKIAQNFVKDLETTPGNAAIVRATIGLARELDIIVIAEGVETGQQLELLKGWGCAEIQGYYFAKPLDPVDLLPLLSAGRILRPWSAPEMASLHPES
jgi:diguanylate cyclase (GGDEF)-like protein/PAS domain S-box-containing protein